MSEESVTENPGKRDAESKKSKAPCRWTKALKIIFIDTVKDKLSKGDTHTDSGFKKCEWTWIVNEFRIRSGTNYDKQQLQSEYNILKKEYGIMEKLKGNSGFGWDNVDDIPTAPESTWIAYLEHHPGARKYRDNAFMNCIS